MEKFCKDLREHATKIINDEKKEIIPLTKKEEKSITSKKFVIYAEKNLIQMITIRVEIIVTILENIEVLLMISVT